MPIRERSTDKLEMQKPLTETKNQHKMQDLQQGQNQYAFRSIVHIKINSKGSVSYSHLYGKALGIPGGSRARVFKK